MKKSEKYLEMKTDELSAQLKELKEKLFRLRFTHATGQLGNPMELNLCKKDIARVKTILREREMKAAAAKGAAVTAKPEAKPAKGTVAAAKAEKAKTEKAEKPAAAPKAKKAAAAK